MKASLTLLALLGAAALSSCSTTASPVYTAPVGQAPAKKIVHAPAAPKAEGALRQVPSTPEKPKPKAFPDIPLKEDTGTSPLIHSKADTPSYKRSTP